MTPSLATTPEEANLNGIPSAEIRAQLDSVLRSRAFVQSHRIRRFLQFVVEESLQGQQHRLKEYLIGIEVFDRRDAFDPRVDSIVRVEARRLRYKLEEYYRAEGHGDPVHIVLRKGSYVPTFEYRIPTTCVNPLLQRRAVEIAPFAVVNASMERLPIAEEMQRRVTHVLVKDGLFQVIVQSPEEGAGGEIVRRARPDCMVEGSIEFKPDQRFHLILQLMQLPDRSYIWSDAIEGQIADLSQVSEAAQSMIRDLTSPLADGTPSRRQAGGAEGRDSYLEGRYHWKQATPGSIQDSVACFARAVDADPNYAAAWAAQAEALIVSSVFGLQEIEGGKERILEAARKSVALAPSLPEAHVAFGAALALLDWNWNAAEEELEKAVQVDGHDFVAQLAYGLLLACRGEFDAAFGRMEKALDNDPASLSANFVLGWLYSVSNRLDEAVGQHLLVSRLAPDYALPRLGLGLAYAAKGDYEEAINHLSNALQMQCRSLVRGLIGFCHARAGRRDEALGEMAALTQERSSSQFASPLSFAAIHAGLGEREKAWEYIERAAESRDTSLALRLLGPEFESLRSDPRFEVLRNRIGVAR